MPSPKDWLQYRACCLTALSLSGSVEHVERSLKSVSMVSMNFAAMRRQLTG